MTLRAYAPSLATVRPCGIVGAVCVCVCLESLPNKEGGRERIHCTMSQRKLGGPAYA